ncbi:MAG: peptidylprolyl isomerase [Woeseiaceae bacterium]
MNPFSIRSRVLARLSATTFTLIAIAFSPLIAAETVRTVNGVDIDSTLLDFYIETRYSKPSASATADERNNALSELVDIYLLTTQPRAVELASQTDIKSQLELQRRGLLAQMTASDYMTKQVPSEEEILKEYEQQIKLTPNSQYKARHILVETQGAAQGIITELDGGADFAKLAAERSTGPSGPNGGDLGWFSPDQMVRPFSDAVIALEDGAYTKAPVQTQFGWHVILREEARANEPPTLDSVREVISQRVAQNKFQEYMESLREAAKN